MRPRGKGAKKAPNSKNPGRRRSAKRYFPPVWWPIADDDRHRRRPRSQAPSGKPVIVGDPVPHRQSANWTWTTTWTARRLLAQTRTGWRRPIPTTACAGAATSSSAARTRTCRPSTRTVDWPVVGRSRAAQRHTHTHTHTHVPGGKIFDRDGRVAEMAIDRPKQRREGSEAGDQSVPEAAAATSLRLIRTTSQAGRWVCRQIQTGREPGRLLSQDGGRDRDVMLRSKYHEESGLPTRRTVPG